MSHESANPCRFVELGQHAPGGFRRNYWMEVTEFPEARAKLGNVGLYATAFRYSEPSPDAELIWGPLYMDFDGEWEEVQKDVLRTLSYLRVVWRLSYSEVRIYFSGQKGCHLIVPAPTLGIQPQSDLHLLYRSIAKDIMTHARTTTLDLKIYDRRRLFRVPNSIHHVTGLYKIPLTVEEAARFSCEKIRELAREPRRFDYPPLKLNSQSNAVLQRYIPKTDELSKDKPPIEMDFDPPCVVKLLEEGVISGSRNLACAALANHLQRRGYSEEETMACLLEWNSKNSPPLEVHEVRNTIRSMYRHAYSYGCTTFSEISTCLTSCPIYNRR